MLRNQRAGEPFVFGRGEIGSGVATTFEGGDRGINDTSEVVPELVRETKLFAAQKILR
jgi:hypothetical protein